MSKTIRGFEIHSFQDANGEECTIQESSAMREEGLIWLGPKEVSVKVLSPGLGWSELPFKELYGDKFIGNQRMHLTQSQVKKLLPLLTYFAECGYLPEESQD